MSEIMTRAALDAKYEIVVGDDLPLSQDLQASIIRSHLAALDEIDRLTRWNPASEPPNDGIDVAVSLICRVTQKTFVVAAWYAKREKEWHGHPSRDDRTLEDDWIIAGWRDLPSPMPETKVGVDETVDIDSMIHLPNQPSYRCECGCNVFRKSKLNEYRFKCNACGAWHVSGETKEPTP